MPHLASNPLSISIITLIKRRMYDEDVVLGFTTLAGKYVEEIEMVRVEMKEEIK